jgi:hypothetical protein
MMVGVGVEPAVEPAVVEVGVNKVEPELGKEAEVAVDVEVATAPLHKGGQILE